MQPGTAAGRMPGVGTRGWGQPHTTVSPDVPEPSASTPLGSGTSGHTTVSPDVPEPSGVEALSPHFTNKKTEAPGKELSSTERSQAHPSSWVHQLYDPTCPRTV